MGTKQTYLRLVVLYGLIGVSSLFVVGCGSTSPSRQEIALNQVGALFFLNFLTMVTVCFFLAGSIDQNSRDSYQTWRFLLCGFGGIAIGAVASVVSFFVAFSIADETQIYDSTKALLLVTLCLYVAFDIAVMVVIRKIFRRR